MLLPFTEQWEKSYAFYNRISYSDLSILNLKVQRL